MPRKSCVPGVKTTFVGVNRSILVCPDIIPKMPNTNIFPIVMSISTLI